MYRISLAFLTLTALAACGNNTRTTPAPTPTSTPSPEPVAAPQPAPSPEPEAEPAADITFEYTTLNLDACETLSEPDEGGGVELRCPGLGDVPLYASEGDLRWDVDAGVPDGQWNTAMTFNHLGDTVEWRIRDGQPKAFILRWHLEHPEGTADEAWLGVNRVGTERAPGCHVGWVKPDAQPSQNEAARAMADKAMDTPCPG